MRKRAPFSNVADPQLTPNAPFFFSTPGDVVISFYIGGHVFHNKLTKVAGGYQNSNGNVFPNLRCVLEAMWLSATHVSDPCSPHRLLLPSLDRTIILLYQGKHPDMQTALTEYVPRERAEQGGVEYANASVMRDNKPTMITVRTFDPRLFPPGQKCVASRLVALPVSRFSCSTTHPSASPCKANVRSAMRWNTVDIQAALAEVDAAEEDDNAVRDFASQPPGFCHAVRPSCQAFVLLLQCRFKFLSTTQGDYDPIYDDVRFGFGNEFVSFVFGAEACEEPKIESILDSDVFNLGDRLDASEEV